MTDAIDWKPKKDWPVHAELFAVGTQMANALIKIVNDPTMHAVLTFVRLRKKYEILSEEFIKYQGVEYTYQMLDEE